MNQLHNSRRKANIELGPKIFIAIIIIIIVYEVCVRAQEGTSYVVFICRCLCSGLKAKVLGICVNIKENFGKEIVIELRFSAHRDSPTHPSWTYALIPGNPCHNSYFFLNCID